MIFLVMELLEGGSLRKYLIKARESGKNIPPKFCALIMKQIIEALLFVHKNHYMHRDLKPENIMFSNNDYLTSLKMIDFGIGMKPTWNPDLGIKSHCGTLCYMSPEQLLNSVCTKVLFISFLICGNVE